MKTELRNPTPRSGWWTWGLRWSPRATVGALLSPIVLGACGPSTPVSVVPTPTQAVSVGLPTASLPALPSAQAGTYPEQDTPFASATTSLARLWARFAVTVIPGRHIYDAIPAPPAVQNNTGGAVSDSDARRWAVAFNRANALMAWGDARGQVILRQSLLGAAYQGGAVGVAASKGWSISWPVCSLYPTSLALYPVDAQVQQYYSLHGQTSAGRFVFVAALPRGACEITAKDSAGTVHDLLTVRQTLFVQGGVFKQDAVLGDIWFSDSGGTCDDSGVPQRLCGRV